MICKEKNYLNFGATFSDDNNYIYKASWYKITLSEKFWTNSIEICIFNDRESH